MWNLVQIKTPYQHFSAQICCRFLNLYWFKNTNQSWMQTSHQCFYAFLTCNRASCLSHHHRYVSSWVMWLRMLRATTSLPKQSFAFSIFPSAFLLTDHKNLHQAHCSSICNALMMITGVIETFAICHWYRFHWPWFSLYRSSYFAIFHSYLIYSISNWGRADKTSLLRLIRFVIVHSCT